MSRWAWVAIALAAGTIPTPWLVAALLGRRDVIAEMRREDSPGDAHFLVVTRISRALGIVTIFLDMVKGFVPLLFAVRARAPLAVLAWAGVAAVAGHSFAPFLRSAGGRGLTTAAGVSLAAVPWAMACTGVIGLGGTLAKRGGLGTSIGFTLLPLFTALFGYPAPLFWMTVGIFGLIALRRLEGIDEDRAAGVALGRAVFGRVFFDLPRGQMR
jgi:glycerol-3-phosphate acyltransferase PlsY